MCYDSLEVLNADDNVHVFFCVKVLKVVNMYGDCGLERLFEDLC